MDDFHRFAQDLVALLGAAVEIERLRRERKENRTSDGARHARPRAQPRHLRGAETKKTPSGN